MAGWRLMKGGRWGLAGTAGQACAYFWVFAEEVSSDGGGAILGYGLVR